MDRRLMRDSWVRYEDIEEKRNGYFVVYSPVFTGQDSATLKIYMYEPNIVKEIKEIAEVELKIWVRRYATPLMVIINNYTQSGWCTKDIVGHSFLLGYPQGEKVISYWDEYPEHEKPNFDLSKEKLAIIYVGLAVRTQEDVIKKQANEARGRKLLLLAMTLWFCIIPASIAYLGWSSPFFSLLALIYSWYLATKKGLQIWGRKTQSQAEMDKRKEELEKEHHHYHCKLNPEAFLALRYENFKNERISKELEKVESMRD